MKPSRRGLRFPASLQQPSRVEGRAACAPLLVAVGADAHQFDGLSVVVRQPQRVVVVRQLPGEEPRPLVVAVAQGNEVVLRFVEPRARRDAAVDVAQFFELVERKAVPVVALCVLPGPHHLRGIKGLRLGLEEEFMVEKQYT